MKITKNIILLICAACTLIILFRSAWKATYVGYFSDDASYITLAKALLNGKGIVALENPGEPPHRLYLPGFPIFLTPFIAIFGEHSEQLRWVNVFITTILIFVCYILFKHKTTNLYLLFILLSLSMNILTIVYASTLMSDLFFSLVSFLTILLLKNYMWQSVPHFVKAFLIGLMIMASSSIRVVGFLLLIPLFYAGLKRRDFKLLIGGSVPPTCLIFAAYLYGWINTYATQLPSMPLNINLQVFFSNIYYYLQTTLMLANNGIINFTKYQSFLSWILLPFMIIGIIRHWKLFGGIWESYFLAYLFTVAFFRLRDPRLLLPILPFVYFFLFYGISSLSNKKHRSIFLVIFSVIFSILALKETIFFYRNVVPSSYFINTPQKATHDWIKSHTLPKDIFLSPSPAQTFFFTNRQGIAFSNISEPITLLEYIYKKNNIDYLYFIPFAPSQDPFRGDISRVNFHKAIASADYHHFKLVFQNETEQTYVYRIIPRHEEFKKAMQAIDNGTFLWLKNDYKAAIQELEKALTFEPDLYIALNRLGVILADSGDTKKAIEVLKKSILLYPSYPQCHVALTYAYEKMGEHSKALSSLHKAWQLATKMSLFPLAVQLETEIDKLHTRKANN